MSLLFLITSLLATDASGFCGTFVGAPGAELANHTSQVVYTRDHDETTLTLVADYTGDLSEFALVLPVPSDLDPARVRVIDPSVVDRLDRYSTPRLVEYTCSDAVTYTHSIPGGPGCAMMVGCSADAAYDDTFGGETLPEDVEFVDVDGQVTVEAEFQVAEYDVVKLSATGAEGLYAWLDLNGYGLPPGGEDILDEYIDGGVSFLAAKVSLEDVPTDTTRLSPLQLSYDTSVLGLPIRIGTISAAAEQEVLLYGITDANTVGELEIRNYREVEPVDECMVPSDDAERFRDFYRERAVDAAEDIEGATWFVEYSWTLYTETEVQTPGGKCDPCTVEREELYDPGELADLGFRSGDAHLTRLRMTYGPDEAHEDLVLAGRGLNGNQQIRYIQYDRQLEFLFPVCGSGFVAEPGQCGDDGTNEVELVPQPARLHPLAVGGLLLLTLAGLRRRL